MAHGATARAGRPAQAQGRGGHGREGAALRQGQRQEDSGGLTSHQLGGAESRQDDELELIESRWTLDHTTFFPGVS